MTAELILIIDDDRPFAETVRSTLALEGYSCVIAPTAAEGVAALEADPQAFALVLLDLRLPDSDGVAVLATLRALRDDLPVVMFTAFGTVQTAVEAMRQGAFDFLLKPFPRERLLGTLERGLERSRLLRENRLLRSQLGAAAPGAELQSRSPAYNRLLEQARQVAPTDATVLLTGETGTGKERLAAYLYAHSRRADGPFLRVNCAALADTLLEAQLFGHRRGAFTGADEARAGLFEEAGGGTLFLDEIGDISAGLQVRLLRVLQEGEFLPVGETRPRRTDVRVIAATNRNLREAVRQGTFREDLYYRLAVVTLPLPPLRERREDLPGLAAEFVADANRRTGKAVRGLTLDALEACQRYPWPGNVRELQNVVERAVILSFDEWLDADSLGLTPAPHGAEAAAGTTGDQPLWAVEKAHIAAVLERHGWVKSASARVLEISRTTLDRKIRDFGLAPAGRPPR